MNKPPMLMRLRFSKRGGKFRIWFPLFILYPFLVIILLLIAPFLAFAALVHRNFGSGKQFILFIPVTLGLFLALRGLEVEINSKKKNVFIHIK